jgi:hypothetical protein
MKYGKRLSEPLVVMVLGSESSALGQFLCQSLENSLLRLRFAEISEDFVTESPETNPNFLIAIDPAWSFFLKVEYDLDAQARLRTRPNVFAVRFDGANWELPWIDGEFFVENLNSDQANFRSVIESWFADLI